MKKRQFDESVHYSIQGRKKYKRKLWIVFAILIVVLLLCSVMFFFGNVTWDPEAGFEPQANPEQPYQIALVVLGALISISALVGTFVYCWFDIGKFYRSQEAYWKSAKFKQDKAKALKCDLKKLDKKTLKWYKKLGYITSAERRNILEQQKAKKDN